MIASSVMAFSFLLRHGLSLTLSFVSCRLIPSIVASPETLTPQERFLTGDLGPVAGLDRALAMKGHRHHEDPV
jgi:hypothetical protein